MSIFYFVSYNKVFFSNLILFSNKINFHQFDFDYLLKIVCGFDLLGNYSIYQSAIS